MTATPPTVDAAALLLSLRTAAVHLGRATLNVRARATLPAESHIRDALAQIVICEAVLAPLAERQQRPTPA